MTTATCSLAGEFDGCVLNDERLEARLQLLVEVLSRDAELSLPEALGQGAQLEAAYRFFNNPRVEAPALLRAHVQATAMRMRAHRRVLAVHDTAEFVFGGQSARRGLEGDRFRAHFSLAVSCDGRREPLGLLAVRPWARAEKKAVVDTRQRRADSTRESKRWLEQSLVVEDVVEGVELIHVEDREADIFDSLSERVRRQMHFIVRAKGQRAIAVDGDRTPMLEHLRAQPRRFEREVFLSRRVASKKGGKKDHPDRDARKTRLAIGAARVELQRPRADDADPAVEPFEVNVVHVVEVGVRADEESVEWLLVTTEPIDSDDDIAFIVDSYRARWVVEEYFKALKTGCAYEARQLESYDALLRVLSLYSVMAWRLLWLRCIAQHTPNTAAAAVATPNELAVLRVQKRIGTEATVGDYLTAIAALGGHIKRNGPPGWQVLWRGHRTLRLLAAGYALSQADDDEK